MTEPLEAPPSGNKSTYVYVAILSSVSAIVAALIGILPFLLGYFDVAPDDIDNDGSGNSKEEEVRKPGPKNDWDGRAGVLVVQSVEVLKKNKQGGNWDSITSDKPDLYVTFHNLSSGQTAQTPTSRNTFLAMFQKGDMIRVQQGDTVQIGVYDYDRTNFPDKVGETKFRLTKALWERKGHDLSFGRVQSLKLRVRK
ncbi:MAG: hypothetical protein ACFCD0_12380 [Gemmataceae bacterium]